MRRRKTRRQIKKQRKMIIISSFALLFCLSVGYSAFNTSINLTAKGNLKGTTIAILKNRVVTSGDGLYKDTYEDNRYIYRGVNPNNYIKLGDDVYRIISIESDDTLKVIRTHSIGNMAFDTENARYSTESTDYCNSTDGCKVWGSKSTTLDANGNNVTQMPTVGDGTLYNLSEKESSLNIYLNNDWYSSLDDSIKNSIVSHIFNVGVTKSNESVLANTVKYESAYKWKGKVGLINLSDYVRASTNPACISVSTYYRDSSYYSNSTTHNWIFTNLDNTISWAITPSPGNSRNLMGGVINDGHVDGYLRCSVTYNVFPVFYLSSNITLKGDGTTNSPFQIKN